jgi:glycosyltransferase involved in cell wall biosynthesis
MNESINTKPIPTFAQYGIAVFHNIGDILLCTPIARQLKTSDPSCFITWYTSERYAFVLDNNPHIDEVVALPASDPVTLDALIPELRVERAWTRFITPAPYMNYTTKPHLVVEAGISLLDLVRDAAGLKWNVPFMPVVRLSDTEVQRARNYWSTLPAGGPIILVESEFKSDQTLWDENFALEMVDVLKDLNPVFVYSAKNRPRYLDLLLERHDRTFWCDLPFRLNAELFNLCDGFVGVSSGISTLTYSTWCRDDVPRIEVSRGAHWSGFQHLKTRLLAVCYTRPHYSEALEWLCNRLVKAIPTDHGKNTAIDDISRDESISLTPPHFQAGEGASEAPAKQGMEAPQPREPDSNPRDATDRLNVALDISVLGIGHVHDRARTGIYRFVDNLLKGLAGRSDISLSLATHSSLLDATREYVFSHIGAACEVLELSQVPDGDLLHSPFFPLPAASGKGARVLTVHDLISIKFPHFFEIADGDSLRKIIASLGADDFVTVNSEATKADLCAYAPHIPSDRIAVTPLAADDRIFYPCLNAEEKSRIFAKYHLEPTTRYLLSVATLEPRKNIAHLIKAFVRLLNEDKITDLKLVLVGTKGWKFDGIFDELSLAGDMRERIALAGFVPDEDMAALYSNAMAFAYPSLYEGFGLPPLEAMQCGTPVITSNNSSLPEVVGDAGILVPAQDENALVEAIRSLYHNEQMRIDLSHKGIIRAATFTWERCVEQTVETYKMAYEHWQSKLPSACDELRPIIIDSVAFQILKTGIARVWRTLLREWAGSEFGKRLIILDRVFKGERVAPRFEGLRYIDVPPYDFLDTENDRVMLQRICDEENAVLFISTYFTTPLSTPSVFIAHDMMPELADIDIDYNPMWKEKQISIRHASRFVCVSQNTANDLQHFYPDISTEHITVAHCGIDFKQPDSKAVSAFRKTYGIERPYFLTVGSRVDYKNCIQFFRAFTALGDARADYAIVCTGLALELEPEFAILIGDATVHVICVNDEELQAAYAGALALVFPSLYEGFGMPVAEAMACGCPVITSNRGSLIEVAGDAALFVDIGDIEGTTQALCDVQDPAVRKRMIAQGLERSKAFSWHKMTEAVRQVLEKAAAELAGQQAGLPTAAMTPEQALTVAFQHHQAGQLEQAEMIYRQILVDVPNNFVALHMLGVLRFQQNDLASAEHLLQRAKAINSSIPEIHFNLANVYAAQQRTIDARACYMQALAINNVFEPARQQLNLLVQTTGPKITKPSNIARDFKRVPDEIAVTASVVKALQLDEQGHTPQAIKLFREVLFTSPDDWRALYSLGRILLYGGNPGEAIKLIDRLVVVNNQFAPGFFMRTEALIALGRFEEALTEISQCLSFDPAIADALKLLAGLKLKLNMSNVSRYLIHGPANQPKVKLNLLGLNVSFIRQA